MSSMTYVTDAATLGTGLLLARLILGVLMVAHGGQKLFGWIGGHGIAGTAGFFEQLGFRPGKLFAVSASLAEVVSGILIALGLFGPVGPALLLSVMIVAVVSVHWKHTALKRMKHAKRGAVAPRQVECARQRKFRES